MLMALNKICLFSAQWQGSTGQLFHQHLVALNHLNTLHVCVLPEAGSHLSEFITTLIWKEACLLNHLLTASPSLSPVKLLFPSRANPSLFTSASSPLCRPSLHPSIPCQSIFSSQNGSRILPSPG